MANTKAKVAFGAGESAFNTTPRLFMGLSALDMDSCRAIKAKVFADMMNSEGFTWYGESWDNSLLCSIGADWIPFGHVFHASRAVAQRH